MYPVRLMVYQVLVVVETKALFFLCQDAEEQGPSSIVPTNRKACSCDVKAEAALVDGRRDKKWLIIGRKVLVLGHVCNRIGPQYHRGDGDDLLFLA